MLALLVMVGAHAGSDGPPVRERGQQTVVVIDPGVEGDVRLVLPGKEGATVAVDGLALGTLPLETVLAEGLHTFRIVHASETREVDIVVTPSVSKTVELDLTPPPAKAEEPAS